MKIKKIPMTSPTGPHFWMFVIRNARMVELEGFMNRLLRAYIVRTHSLWSMKTGGQEVKGELILARSHNIRDRWAHQKIRSLSLVPWCGRQIDLETPWRSVSLLSLSCKFPTKISRDKRHPVDCGHNLPSSTSVWLSGATVSPTIFKLSDRFVVMGLVQRKGISYGTSASARWI